MAEKACVEGILAKARSTRTTPAVRAATGPPDSSMCPITSEHLHRHFTEVNAPKSRFDAMAPVGAKFRAALARLPAATEATELLTDAPTERPTPAWTAWDTTPTSRSPPSYYRCYSHPSSAAGGTNEYRRAGSRASCV
ncbi:hypothetical protein PI124_g20199 [Phytophthora idaei]|nr:hypothetical protein PI125_g21425 [Phytophthora idaei]KAG3132046.1 hypothetical protein PI126_g19808 [Phytophthora idaei]KAG3234751.1 hypothetical protein PI124_g20199 [Phytophthora idaei]